MVCPMADAIGTVIADIFPQVFLSHEGGNGSPPLCLQYQPLRDAEVGNNKE
jgi:hypothetical protein